MMPGGADSQPLSYYQNIVDCLQCPDCRGALDAIEMYPHDGGWRVDGYEKRQWLSSHCRKCHYDWSLWKLGILGSVEHPEPEIGVLDAQ